MTTLKFENNKIYSTSTLCEKTLYELFMGCNWNACRVPWRIYGENNKLICKNYSAETSDEFDNMQVKSYSYSKKKDYVRVYVK